MYLVYVLRISRIDTNHKVNEMNIKSELCNFISNAVDGDRSRYAGRSLLLAEDFARFLGLYAKYPNGIMQPDGDPKWSPAQWNISISGFSSFFGSGYVNEVRVMTFRHLYTTSLMEIASERKTVLPNGMHLEDVIRSLIDIHQELKQGAGTNGESIMVSRYLLNTMYPMISRYGKPIGIGGHHITQRSRERIKHAVIKINKTGVVLSVFFDEIVYKGDQVCIDGVHHEKFDKAIFTDKACAYGNNIRSQSLPRIRFSGNDEYYTDLPRNIEHIKSRMVERVSKAKASVAEYFNRTLEDVNRKNAIDSGCDFL